MGGFETIDEGILAGALIENEDIDASAAINPLKTEKRKILIPAYISGSVLTGVGILSTGVNYIPYILLIYDAAGTINMSICCPKAEIAPGEKGTLHIWWLAAETATSLRLVVDIKPIIQGTENLLSAITKTDLSVPSGSNLCTDAKIEIPYAVLSNNQNLAIQIYRDPANTLDTLTVSVVLFCVYLEVLGRC